MRLLRHGCRKVLAFESGEGSVEKSRRDCRIRAVVFPRCRAPRPRVSASGSQPMIVVGGHHEVGRGRVAQPLHEKSIAGNA
jgi:hypothetical protein